MATVRMEWMPSSKSQFERIRQRAKDSEELSRFQQTHTEIALALTDLDSSLAKGEVLNLTRKPGGEIHHWLYRFISVWYVVFPEEKAGWILRYQCFPESWPF